MLVKKPLFGSSIVLRHLTVEDASDLYLSWMRDMDVIRYLELRFSPPRNILELRKFIQSCYDSEDTLLLGIYLQENYCHIGNIKLGPIDRHHSSGDIGLLIGDRNQWGKGHGTAAISMLAGYAFDHLGLAKLTAGCYAENMGSRNAFLKAGFLQEGLRQSQFLINGQRQDGLLFGLVSPRIGRINDVS